MMRDSGVPSLRGVSDHQAHLTSVPAGLQVYIGKKRGPGEGHTREALP